MIGPGTGLAPFRGFLQERASQKASGKTLGPAMLFFGCRHPEQDFLYADELKDFADQNVSELHVAFSRGSGPKTYVQDLIAAQKDRVWSLIEQGAVIFVCGDGGKMEPDVKRKLMDIYREKTSAERGSGCALDRRHGHAEPLRAGRVGGELAVIAGHVTRARRHSAAREARFFSHFLPLASADSPEGGRRVAGEGSARAATTLGMLLQRSAIRDSRRGVSSRFRCAPSGYEGCAGCSTIEADDRARSRSASRHSARRAAERRSNPARAKRAN